MYAEILAKEGIIVRRESPEQYRLSDPILRQEMTGIALQVADVSLPQEYVCRGYFSDVSRVQKDGWVCRAAELARDQGIITSVNKTFRPRDFVTRAEALAIVVQASGMKTYPENYTSNWLRTE